MTITDADERRTIELLEADVRATLGVGHETVIHDNARRLRQFIDEPEQYVNRVVEDTQQDFHDVFIDTTWPTCPLHKRHPLWFHEGGWWCEEDQVLIAKLGELRSI